MILFLSQAKCLRLAVRCVYYCLEITSRNLVLYMIYSYYFLSTWKSAYIIVFRIQCVHVCILIKISFLKKLCHVICRSCVIMTGEQKDKILKLIKFVSNFNELWLTGFAYFWTRYIAAFAFCITTSDSLYKHLLHDSVVLR